MAIVTFSNGIKVNFNGNPTKDDIEEVANRIFKSQDINALGAAVEGVKQTFQQKEEATLNPISYAKTYLADNIGKSISDSVDKIYETMQTWDKKTTSQKVAGAGESGLSIINAVLSPISGAFKTAEKVPVLGNIATGVNALFGAIGAGGGAIANNVLNKLPFSDKTKEDLRPVVNEAGALASQIVSGKAGLDTVFAKTNMKVLDTLNKGIKQEVPPEIASKMPDIDMAKVESPVIETTKIEIPKEVKPEIPQTTPSGISKKIEAKAIEKGLTDSGFDELAGYDSSTIKEQGKRGSQFSLDEHIKMVKTGELPNGIKPATPFSIVEKYANETNNIELQKELAKSPLATKISESASELSLSRMRDKEGAVAKIKEVIDYRKEKFKDQIKAETTKIKKSIGKPTKEAWLKFIEEIKC